MTSLSPTDSILLEFNHALDKDSLAGHVTLMNLDAVPKEEQSCDRSVAD